MPRTLGGWSGGQKAVDCSQISGNNLASRAVVITSGPSRITFYLDILIRSLSCESSEGYVLTHSGSRGIHIVKPGQAYWPISKEGYNGRNSTPLLATGACSNVTVGRYSVWLSSHSVSVRQKALLNVIDSWCISDITSWFSESRETGIFVLPLDLILTINKKLVLNLNLIKLVFRFMKTIAKSFNKANDCLELQIYRLTWEYKHLFRLALNGCFQLIHGESYRLLNASE